MQPSPERWRQIAEKRERRLARANELLDEVVASLRARAARKHIDPVELSALADYIDSARHKR